MDNIYTQREQDAEFYGNGVVYADEFDEISGKVAGEIDEDFDGEEYEERESEDDIAKAWGF